MSFLDDIFRKPGALSLYGQLAIYINGSLLTETTSISISRSMETQDIHLVGGGFQGILTSTPVVTVEVKSATPSTSFELDPGRFMKSNAQINFTISNSGSNTIQFKGFIIEDNFESAVNSNSTLSFKAKGIFQHFTTK